MAKVCTFALSKHVWHVPLCRIDVILHVARSVFVQSAACKTFTRTPCTCKYIYALWQRAYFARRTKRFCAKCGVQNFYSHALHVQIYLRTLATCVF